MKQLARIALFVCLSVAAYATNLSGSVSGATAVTITLSGGASRTTTTSTSGTYRFTSLSNGSYTVTPVKSGYTFTPASRSVSGSGNIKSVDFVATANTPPPPPPPPAHSVSLSWSPSTSSSISGYRVYRGATAGGAYSKVADVTSTSYLDQSVTAGATYYYVTTAYNVDGESVHSNEVQAVIPTP